MSTLTGRTIGDSYTELLKTADSNGVTSSLTIVEDGDATASALQISTQGIRSTGSLVVDGQSSVVDLASSGNVSVLLDFSVDGNTTLGNDEAIDRTEFKSRVASSLTPFQDNSYDLGSSSLEWKDLFVDGTANIDSLVADTADINGGTIDAATIGATSASTGRFTQVNIEAQGQLRLEDTAGGQYVGFRAPGTVSSSYTLTLPSAAGTAGFTLISDGTGNLLWQNPYGGGATSLISAGNTSLTVLDPGVGQIVGAIDGTNLFIFNGTGLAVTGSVSATTGFSGDLTGNASTATTLQTSRNFSITGDVTASAVSFNGSGDVALGTTLSSGVVSNTNVSNTAAIAFSKLENLSSANILVGNASNVATSVSLSGDATISNTGSLTIANNAITNAKVSTTAAIAFSKLASLTSGNILVGSAANVPTSVAVSGDATLANTGALTIANNAITTAKIANSAVDSTKVATASVAVLGTAQEYTRAHNFNATVLTDAANIAWDLSQNQVASVTLGGNRTLSNPTNKVDGATYILIVKQDGTGGKTLAYSSDYKFPGNVAPVVTSGANKVSILTFVCDGTNLYGVSTLNYL